MCTYTTHSVYMYGVTLVGTYVIFLIFHVSPCLWVFGNMLVYVIWEYGTERLYVCVCVCVCVCFLHLCEYLHIDDLVSRCISVMCCQ